MAEAPATLELLSGLVEQESVEGNEAAIAACLDLVEDAIRAYAREIERPVFDGLPGLIARFGDGPAERMVTFSGHIDVVPAEGVWLSPPFAFVFDGDQARGRGVCDMKAGVAAFAGAIRALGAAGRLPECAIELAITADEEVGSRRGTRRWLAEGLIQGTAAICGEPTALDVYLGNRGVAWYEIEIRGRGGHAGQLQALDSPVGAAIDVMAALTARQLTKRDDRFDPPTASLAITRLDAGASTRAINVVPDVVTIGIDRRFLPGESIDAETAEIEHLVNASVRPPLTAEVRVLNAFPPCETAEDHPITRAAVAAAKQSGRRGALGMDRAANDSSWFVEAGIPALLLGPGDPEQAHVTDESLALSDLRDAVLLYAELALAYRG